MSAGLTFSTNYGQTMSARSLTDARRRGDAEGMTVHDHCAAPILAVLLARKLNELEHRDVFGDDNDDSSSGKVRDSDATELRERLAVDAHVLADVMVRESCKYYGRDLRAEIDVSGDDVDGWYAVCAAMTCWTATRM